MEMRAIPSTGEKIPVALSNYAPDRMWAAALTLILLVLLLNLVARLIGRRNALPK